MPYPAVNTFKMHCNCGDQDDLDNYEETRLLAFFLSKAQL